MPENINLLDISEMLKLLRGQYPVRRVIRSQFDHERMNLPTEPSVVLGDFIYETPCCQCVFQDALKVLLSGSTDDVFLGFAYIEESLLNEKLNIAGIRIDLEMLLPPLKEGIRRTLSGLSNRTAFCSTSCLEWIRTVSSSYEKEYGFTLLDE